MSSSSPVFLGVYLRGALVSKLPREIQETVYLLKIKKILGGLTETGKYLTNEKRSFKAQYNLLLRVEITEFISEDPIYALAFLEINPKQIETYLEGFPKKKLINMPYLELVVEHGYFEVYKLVSSLYDHRRSSRALKLALEKGNYPVVKGILTTVSPNSSRWDSIFYKLGRLDELALSGSRDLSLDFGITKEAPMEGLKNFYRDLFKRMTSSTVRRVLYYYREAPVRVFFENLGPIDPRKKEDPDVSLALELLDKAHFNEKFLKELYHQVSPLGPGYFVFDSSREFSLGALEYFYELDGLIAFNLGEQINRHLVRKNWETLKFLIKVSPDPSSLERVTNTAFVSKPEVYKEFIENFGGFLSNEIWEKVLLERLIKYGLKEPISSFLALKEDRIKDKEKLVKAIKKLSGAHQWREALKASLRLLQDQEFSFEEAHQILSSYDQSPAYSRLYLALLPLLSYEDLSMMGLYKNRALEKALKFHDFETALFIFLQDEALLEKLSLNLLKDPKVLDFIMGTFPEYYIDFERLFS